MMKFHLDFETRSSLDITKVGAYCYSRHPSTQILCAVYAFEENTPELITSIHTDLEMHYSATDGRCIELFRHAFNSDTIFYAHNAFFEQCIWRNIMVERYGYPEIPIHRWRCTAAKAAAMSLPRDLEGVGLALDLPIQKDLEGNKVMKKLSKPRKATKKSGSEWYEPDEFPDEFKKLYAYCITDVETERLVDQALPDLSKREQEIWFLDQEINFRGIQLDVPLIHRILSFIELTVEDLTAEFYQLTDYQVDNPSKLVVFKNWLESEGLQMLDLQAATVDYVLEHGCPSPKARRALEIRRALSKISTKKYEAMLHRVDSKDGRLRDILLYCAALTKRWGGRGVQLQNMPRGTVDSDEVANTVIYDDYDWFRSVYSDPMSAYSSTIRGCLISGAGSDLLVCDFSSIEAVTLPWLAEQDSTLEVFRQGEDLYCHEAEHIFGRKIDKSQKYERQVGKTAVLGLGYQGGIGAFGTMARAFNVNLEPAYHVLWASATEEEKEKARSAYQYYLKRNEKEALKKPIGHAEGYAADIIKQRWRASNAYVVEFWRAIENAAINAVLLGEKQTVGKITFGMYGPYLLCKLPSGTCLSYPDAKVSNAEDPFGRKKKTLTYKTQNDQNFQYARTYTYGGKLVENITQAVSRDLLADAMIRVEKGGYPIVLHVHDEIVSEKPEGEGSLEEFTQLMSEVPIWAEGLPLKAEGWRGKRYKK